MIKLFFLTTFLLTGAYPLKAAMAPGDNHDFMKDLDSIKDPFEEGFPKPVPVVLQRPAMVNHPGPPSHHKVTPSQPRPIHQPVITLPSLDLQGVIVGDGIYQAIINGNIVPLHGSIEGAEVFSVSKEGVELWYKGKKFFLKVD